MALTILLILSLLGKLEAATLETFDYDFSCSDGFYLNDAECISCSPLCATCSSDDSCDSCVSNSSILNGTLCYCDNGFQTDWTGASCDAGESFLEYVFLN